MADQKTMLSADRPLEDPQGDLLGYQSFAKHLASAVAKMAPVDGLVVAIHGPWGSGKSTLLNFLTHFLGQHPQAQRPEVIRFNPWWFSGSDALVRSFFGQLADSIDARDATRKKIQNLLAGIGEVVTGLPIPDGGVWVFAKPALKKLVKRVRPGEKNVGELKAELDRLLRDHNCRFLVVMDDIDRLTADEIRQLFSTIKAVANLPNVIYLLAFDKRVVTSALDELHHDHDTSIGYLEKIVQVPFELPLPERTLLQKVLLERLDSVLQPLEESEFDKHYWGNVFFDGIEPLIKTPRDIVRLCNALAVTLPAVRGEVNPVDFIAIETIRLFAPHVYDEIRFNPDEFTGTLDRDGDRDDRKAFHEAYIKKLGTELREPIHNLLQRLFPGLQKIWHNMGYDSGFEAQWRRDLRVCSSEVFPVYFRLAVPQDAIGAQRMREGVELGASPEAFARHLESLSQSITPRGSTRARLFLQRLEDFTEKQIPKSRVRPMLLGIFDAADALYRSEPDHFYMFDISILHQVDRVVYQLLERLDDQERLDVLEDVVDTANSVAAIAGTVVRLGWVHGKYGAREPTPENERLISLQAQESLEKRAAARIKQDAEAGSLVESPMLARVLRAWQDFQEADECGQWLSSVRETHEFLVALVSSALSTSHSIGLGFFGLGDRVGQRNYTVSLELLRRFIDPVAVRPTVDTLLQTANLSNRERRALETFIEAHDKEREDNSGDAH